MMHKKYAFILLGVVLVGLALTSLQSNEQVKSMQTQQQNELMITTPVTVPQGLEVVTIAGGCFWCTEAVFQETEGIGDVISGYAGGQEENPTYGEVINKQTGHREAVQFFFDPGVISYKQILDILWQTIDPTDAGGQFVDRGFSYTTAVFYHTQEQQDIATQSIAALEVSSRFDLPIATKILPFTTFYVAEDEHQDFYINASERYKGYESNSGRQQYKEAIWADIQQSEM